MSAPQVQHCASKLRFGLFEVDLHTRELFKQAHVRIQGQPFEILRVLLDRAGETVSSDELRRRLWSQNIYVAYEDSRNTAVRKLQGRAFCTKIQDIGIWEEKT